MDVIVRDANGNELFRSNRLGAATGGRQWLDLTGYGVESADVTFTADYVVVTLSLDEGIYPPEADA